MEKKFSEMLPAELQHQIAQFKVKAQKAEQMGMISEFAVYERKMLLAQAYLLDPNDFLPGVRYELKGEPGEFFDITYLNGVFAWGYRNKQKEEEGIPISLLGSPLKKDISNGGL